MMAERMVKFKSSKALFDTYLSEQQQGPGHKLSMDEADSFISFELKLSQADTAMRKFDKDITEVINGLCQAHSGTIIDKSCN